MQPRSSRLLRTPIAVLVVLPALWLLVVPLVLAGTSGPGDREPARMPVAHEAALPACTIIGTAAAETLVGTSGDDVICALGGNDVVRGRGGNDVLFGSLGNDRLNGGAGRDKLYGHFGADELNGGGGRDFLQGGRDGDIYAGGAGRDTADYSTRLTPVTVSIGRGGANDGGLGEGDRVRGDVERVLGGLAADRLVGNRGANRLLGRGGDDVLIGRRGDDRLRGGGGVDRVDGRDAARFEDALRCGAGEPDVALVDAADTVAADCENVMRPPPTPEAPAGRNHPPTNIMLSNGSVAENLPIGTLVGTLDAADEDSGDTHRFTLVNGNGSADNGAFAIAGDQLKTAAVFDFEAKRSYSVRVRARDERGATFQKALTISVADVAENVNHAPTDVSLAPASVDENEAAGTGVGMLSAADADAGQAHTFALVPGAGSADNAAFAIAGNQLRTAQTFDFESRSSYSIRVATTDAAGATFAKALTVTVADVNDAPSAITLSPSSVSESEPAGTDVGTLAAADQDASQGHSFALVSGAGDAGNDAFEISGSTLKTAEVLDFETKPSYSIRVRATDDGSPARSVERTFTVTVVDANEAGIADPKTLITDEDGGPSTVTLSGSDLDGPTDLTFATADAPAHGSLGALGPVTCDHASPNVCEANVQYTPDGDFNGADSFTYTVDDGVHASAPATVSITVDPVNDAPTAAPDDVSVGEDGSAPVDLTALVSDVETAKDDLIYEIESAPAHGELTGSGGSRTYAPADDYNGADAFTYMVTDRGDPDDCSGGGCDAEESSTIETVSITVAPDNDAPVTLPASRSVDEDGSVPIDLAALVSDVETGDANLDIDVADPEHGAFAAGTYAPDPDFNGVDSVTYEVTDRGDPDNCSGGSCDTPETSTGTVSITVDPINDAPVTTPASLSVDEDETLAIDLAGFVDDVETAGDDLEFELVSPPQHGAFADGVYTPAADFNGSDGFTYEVTDGGDPDGCTGAPCDAALTRVGTVSITVDPVNDAPTADAKSVTGVAEEVPRSIELSGGDTDGDALTFAVGSAPAHGTLGALGPVTCDGSTPSGCTATVVYTPAPNFNGSDSFTYTVGDGTSGSPPATVSITVDPVNDQPTANAISTSVDEDAATEVDLADAVSDLETADADLTYTIVSPPSHGALGGSGGARTYAPDGNFNGTDTFTYEVSDRGDPDGCSGAPCDGELTSATRTVTITVDPVDDAPVATPGSATVDEDNALPIDLGGLVDDVETADADLAYAVGTPAHGTLLGSGGSRTYMPNSDFNGVDTFTYEVGDRGDPDNCSAPPCDGPKISDEQTVSITVNAVNDAPVNFLPAGPLTAVQDTDTPLTGLSIADVDAGGDSVDVAVSVDHGTLTVSTSVLGGLTLTQVAGNGTGDVAISASLAAINATLADANGLVYHGDAPYTGPDELTIATSDAGHNGAGGPLTDTDTLAIDVQPPNAAPVAAAQSVSTSEDTAKTITLSASDADGDPLTLAIATGPAHGSLGAIGTFSCTGATPNVCTGNVTYTPNPDYFGPDSFTFTASDPLATSAPATVSITVDPVNDAPQLANTEPTALGYTENDAATTITSATTVSDIDSANFDTGTLTVDYAGGGTADDRLEIANQGNGPGQIGVSGTTVSFASTPIGTFAGGTGTTPLVVTLDASATVSATQALIRAITYRNVSDAPATAPRTARFVLTDGDGGTSNAATRAVTVSAVNDAPVLANIDPAALAYTENGAPAPITTALTVADVDSSITGATVTISDGFAGAAQDVLTFVNQNGITGDYSGGVLTLSGTTSAANYQTALRSVTYHNASEDPTTDTRKITFQVRDGAAPANLSNTQSRDITVTAVNDAPVADDETFSGANGAIGNTALVVDDPTDGAPTLSSPKKSISGDILAGDTDVDDSSVAVQPVTDQLTNDGGRVTIEADGDFVYVNDPADACSDTSDFFDYTVTDQNTPTAGTDTGRVTISIAGCVWYVSNNASGNSGTSNAPFDTIDQAETASGANHTVFVFDGTGSAYSATGGYAMNAGERLIGEHEGLVVDPDGGASLPSETLYPANPGARPTLTATSADVVDLDDGNEIRGVEVDPQNAGGIAGGTGDTGGGTIDDVNVVDTLGSNATQAGLELSGTTGTFNVTNLSVNTNAAGVLLTNAGTTDFGSTTIASSGLPGLSASGTNMGTSTFDAITVTGSTNGGVSMTNTTGTTVLGDGGGVDLALSTASGTAPAFALSNAGAITVPAGGTANVSATGGPAVDVTGTSGAALSFDAVSSTNSAGDGINLDGLGTGTFSAESGAIGGAAGIAFDLNGGGGAVTYGGALNNGAGQTAEITGRTGGAVTVGGAIADTNDAAGGISLSSNTGGSTTFGNASKVLNTGASNAVSFANSDGHTLNLTGGGLDIDTTSGDGLVATTSGTINVTGTGNSATSTTGRAVNVQNTDFGSSGFTFQSVSANGAPNGILLNNTGTTAGMTITGTGAANSGGSIQNTTQHGVSLTSTDNFSADELSITGANMAGVDGTQVTNFTFTDGEILNAGDSLTDPLHGSIAFNDQAAGTENNIDGTLVITGNLLKDAYGGGVDVFNRAGTITDATVSNNTLDSPADEALTKEDAISFNLFGNASTVASLTKAQIEDNVITDFPSGNGIAFLGAQTNLSPAPTGSVGVPGSATNRILIDGNLLTGDPVNRFGGAAILAGVEGRGQGNFDITNNGTAASPITNVGTHAIATGNSGSSEVEYLIENNNISANNFEAGGGGIRSASDQHIMVGGTTLATPILKTIINNNVVRNTTGIGIRVLAANSNGTANVRVTNNNVANGGAGTPPIDIGNGSSADAAFSHTMCATISGNTTAANAPSPGGNTFPGVLLSKRFTTASQYPFGLTGLSPSPSTNANTEAYVTGLNPNLSIGGGFYAGKRVAVNVGDNFTSCTHPAGF